MLQETWDQWIYVSVVAAHKDVWKLLGLCANTFLFNLGHKTGLYQPSLGKLWSQAFDNNGGL